MTGLDLNTRSFSFTGIPLIPEGLMQCSHCPSFCRSGVHMHRELVPYPTSAAAGHRPVCDALWRSSVTHQHSQVQWSRVCWAHCRPGECCWSSVIGLKESLHWPGLYLQDSLHVCLSRRVPLLLARGLVRLVVLDSLAALFRCEFQAAEWQERTRQMLNVSSTLHRLSQEFTTTVLCINQVIPLSFSPSS